MKARRTRILSCIAAAVLTVASFSGCQAGSSGLKSTEALTIMLPMDEATAEQVMPGVLESYRAAYPDVTLTVTPYTDQSQLQQMLQSSPATAPDLIVLDSTWDSGNTIEWAKQYGMDLASVTATDATFDTAAYYDKVWSAGAIKGEQYLAPVTFQQKVF